MYTIRRKQTKSNKWRSGRGFEGLLSKLFTSTLNRNAIYKANVIVCHPYSAVKSVFHSLRWKRLHLYFIIVYRKLFYSVFLRLWVFVTFSRCVCCALFVHPTNCHSNKRIPWIGAMFNNQYTIHGKFWLHFPNHFIDAMTVFLFHFIFSFINFPLKSRREKKIVWQHQHNENCLRISMVKVAHCFRVLYLSYSTVTLTFFQWKRDVNKSKFMEFCTKL